MSQRSPVHEEARLPYAPPELEGLGSLVEMTQTGPPSANGPDGTGYTPDTPPAGS
jgi:hypothetical protein